jgi:signal peptidase II
MSLSLKNSLWVFFWTALWGALDQGTKYLALAFLDEYGHKEIIQGLLSLALTFNPGGAFGIFSTYSSIFRNTLFFLSALIALGAILTWLMLTSHHDAKTLFGIGAILGGALGNGLDRLRFGSVVDFIDLHVNAYHWPTFNVADIAITLGVLLAFLPSLFYQKKESPACTQKS